MNNFTSVYHIPPRVDQIILPPQLQPRFTLMPMNANYNANSKPNANTKPNTDAKTTANNHGRSGPQRTALESHVAFFDSDGDGIIWPSDTYAGFRRIGFGILFSMIAMVTIHATFSWVTYGTLFHDPFFRLKVQNMHRGRHGSDTGVYTSTGAFDEGRFNDMFDLYSSEPHTHLTVLECVRMLHGNRNIFDPVGWLASATEWITAYLAIWPADGRMSKEDIRGVYDGTFFYKVSERSKKSK